MSSFSSLFPVQTSPIKSIQSGFVSTSSSSAGTGNDGSYVDVTITAVDVAKAAVSVVGSGATSAGSAGYYAKLSTADQVILFGRLTSATNLRVYTSNTGYGHLRASWEVVEYA